MGDFFYFHMKELRHAYHHISHRLTPRAAG